ncbi:pepsin/retropepsin-like aspartic protease family protein [Flavitalea flava]
MRLGKIGGILLFILLSLFQARGQQGNNSALKSKLKYLLEQNDFFRLQTIFNREGNKLTEKDRLYFQAFIDNAFNRCEASVREIDSYLDSYGKDTHDTIKVSLLSCRMDDYSKIYDYKLAGETGEKLITEYEKAMPADQLATFKNSTQLWKFLSSIPRQRTVHKTSRISWKRDKVGLVNIPVMVNDQTDSFVFDTGANISTISQSYADKLHLQIIPGVIDLGSGTSIVNKASMALAKKIVIGNIEVYNVVFMVLPDDQLSFPSLQYSIHAILGFPVISQMGEIHLLQTGTMVFPETPTAKNNNNLALFGLFPVISLRTDQDTLAYLFDTGGQTSQLSKKYFDKYRTEVSRNGKEDSISLGSAGGSVKIKAFKLPEVSFYTGDKKVVLQNLNVLTAGIGEVDLFYGSIGQDFISKFDELVISFSPIYIDFR